MAPPPVVTLFEKYGAAARYIGPRVADVLGVAWLDQAVSSADIESARVTRARAERARRGVSWRASLVPMRRERRSWMTPASLWLRRRTPRWLMRTPVLSRMSSSARRRDAWSQRRPDPW